MPQALVTVNGTPGSELNAPINVLVQLDNQNVGGETTYTWALLDQPPGAADNLSSVSVQNPTFTPKKEGSYLVRLTVNQGQATEQENRVVVAVRQLKTLERVPAAGETTEADAGKGWAAASNSYLRRIDTLLGDPGVLVGVNASGAPRARGDVLRATSVATVKAGLPGEERLPGFTLASAATQAQVDELLVVLEGTVDGNPSVPAGALCRVRYAGRFAGQAGGPPAAGDAVYVSDAGALSLTPGTVMRRVGSAMTAANPFDVWFSGMGDVDSTPIDRRYVVHGPGGLLPNAVRVDGASASGLTTPLRVKAGDAATVPLQAQRFAAGADVQQWLNEAGAVLARVTNLGQLTLDAEGLSVLTAGRHVTFGNSGQRVAWPDWYFTQQSSAELRAGNGVGVFQVVTGASSAAMYVSKALTAGIVADDALGLIVSMDDIAAPIRFSIDGTERWQITAGGTLQASGGNRLVSNVQDPVSAQDAATKNYAVARVPPAWTAMTLLTPWSALSETPSYRFEVTTKRVYLKGALTGTITGGADWDFWNLPAGHVPLFDTYVPAVVFDSGSLTYKNAVLHVAVGGTPFVELYTVGGASPGNISYDIFLTGVTWTID